MSVNINLMSEQIKSLTKMIIDFRNQRNWKQFHNPKDTAISLVLESTEFLEHFQWKNKKEIEEHIVKNKEQLSEEIADVFYWVLLIAHDLNIDPSEALTNKMIKNKAKYPVSKSKNNHIKYTDL